MDAPRPILDRGLTVLAALGLCCVAMTVLGPLLGVRLLVVRSGSMEPTIGTGALGVVKRVPVEDVRRGDIVSVRTPDGSRVTHRVVARQGHSLQLKGDANRAPDPSPYTTATADRLVAHVGGLGYVVGRVAPFVVVPLAAGLLALVLRPQLLGERKPRHRTTRTRRLSPRRAAVLTVTVVGCALLGPGQVRAGWSAWADQAQVSASYDAQTVTAPVLSCGTLQMSSTTLSWTAVPGASGYRLHYGIGGATVESVGSGVTEKTFTSVSTGTFWVEAEHGFGATTWRSAISNKKLYTAVMLAVGTCLDA